MGNHLGSSPSFKFKEDDSLGSSRTYSDLVEGEHPVAKTVKRKLKEANPKLKDKEVAKLAASLFDSSKIKEHYFAHLLQGDVKNGESQPAGLARAAQVPVKVRFCDTTDEVVVTEVAKALQEFCPSYTYGPYQATLQVGDVILEWDERSLVIPRFASDMQDTAKVATAASAACCHHADPSGELSLVLEITEGLVDELIHLMTKYNTKYFYGIFSCNPQHFVQEALEALDLTDQADPFHEQLKLHNQVLIKRGNDKLSEFNTHKLLDDYVKSSIEEEMTPEDKQFCHGHYLLLHHWGEKMPGKEAWRCDPDTCQATLVMTGQGVLPQQID